MSDLTMHELYNHQMAVYGDSEFNKKRIDTAELKRREELLGYNGSRSQQIMMDNFISPNPFG